MMNDPFTPDPIDPSTHPPMGNDDARGPGHGRPWEGAVRSTLDAWDLLRAEAVRGWKILLRLLKGSQLTQERRKLLEQLGVIAAERLRDGSWSAGAAQDGARIATMLDLLDRLDRKIRLEERLITQLRSRTSRRASGPTPDEGAMP